MKVNLSGSDKVPAAIDIFEHYQLMEADRTILAYRGVFNEKTIATILQFVELKMHETDVRTGLRKKLVNVLIEALQNIYHHGTIAGGGDLMYDAMLLVGRTDNGFFVLTGNLIAPGKARQLTAWLDELNRMSPTLLSDRYRSILSDKPAVRPEGHRGARVGLIDMARRSGNHIQYQVQDVNEDQQFICLHVTVGS